MDTERGGHARSWRDDNSQVADTSGPLARRKTGQVPGALASRGICNVAVMVPNYLESANRCGVVAMNWTRFSRGTASVAGISAAIIIITAAANRY